MKLKQLVIILSLSLSLILSLTIVFKTLAAPGNPVLEPPRNSHTVPLTTTNIGAHDFMSPPEPYLFKDINVGASDSWPNAFLQVGDTLFFPASDVTHGHELWATDGTPDGTRMVKDINPGVGNGLSFIGMVELNGVLFMIATDGVHGYELWRSDGTEDGTTMIKDINPGGGNSINEYLMWYFAVMDGMLFFDADDGTNGRELWRSDGTEAGTVMFQDLYSAGGSSPQQFTEMNGILFFSAAGDGCWRELWASDGTVTGTVTVKDINPGIGESFPSGLTVLNGTLFFSADDGTHGKELWASDGTEAGTTMIKDINPWGGSSPTALAVVNGALFFNADDGTHGYEPWRSDGTEDGTTMVTDINPGSGSGVYESNRYFTVADTLFFAANDGIHNFELWVIDTATGGAAMVKDIHPSDYAWPSAFAHFGDTLFFNADDGTHGQELWALPLYDLSLSKSVTPTAGATHHGPITYTLTLPNAGWVTENAAQIVDALPDEIEFDRWVERPSGATVDGDEIRWNGNVPAGDTITLTFSALHTGGYGDVVTNTAYFTGSSQTGSAGATFSTNEPIYLPIICKFE